jgi:hypothetical protein
MNPVAVHASQSTRWFLRLWSVSVALLISACGGGTDSAISGDPGSEETVMVAGTTATLSGTVSTTDYMLTSLSWQVSPQDPSAPTLGLSNADCAVVTQTDTPAFLAGSTVATGAGRSSWTCQLGVSAPMSIAHETIYTVLLISTDAYKKTTTRTRTLRVIPGSGSSGNTGSSSISGKTLVARIPAGLVGKPGSLLDLFGSANWFDSNGATTTGPLIQYAWALGAAAPSGVALMSTSNPSTQLYLPPGIAEPITFPVTLTASSSGSRALPAHPF